MLNLLGKNYLSSFSLVGGTALSLHYGHRKSIDIDLFSTKTFVPSDLDNDLTADFDNYVYRGNNRSMLFCNIGPVKTDLVFHPFQLLAPVQTTEGIRMFSIEDIAAMKQFAICKRGTRKDMYDIWMLLQHYSARQLADLFIQKYGEEKLIFLHKSILYFEEAEMSEQPEVLLPGLSWEKVKKDITAAFKSF